MFKFVVFAALCALAAAKPSVVHEATIAHIPAAVSHSHRTDFISNPLVAHTEVVAPVAHHVPIAHVAHHVPIHHVAHAEVVAHHAPVHHVAHSIAAPYFGHHGHLGYAGHLGHQGYVW